MTTDEDDETIPDLVALLGLEFERVDDDPDEDVYWCFYRAGADLLCRRQRLISVNLYMQPAEGVGDDYDAYGHRLFAELSNNAQRDEVEAVFGPPGKSGVWTGPWIEYAATPSANTVRFAFDSDGRLETVSVGAPNWERD